MDYMTKKMARSVNTIFEEMKAEGIRLAADSNNADAVAMFENTSKVAVWRILFYAKAYAIWVLETIFDKHIEVVSSKILEQVPPTLSWHRQKIKAFQYGFSLIQDTDRFNNSSATEQEILDSKIIKYAAVTEALVDDKRVLVYKIAKLNGSNLVPLEPSELLAFKSYLESYKPAGITIIIYNQIADLIRCTIDVWYNPLIIDNNGMATNGNGYPVKAAAEEYLTNLEFDGEFITSAFVDAIQDANGVSRRKVQISSIERKTEGGNWQSTGISFIPQSGYCKFDVDGLNINYHADI